MDSEQNRRRWPLTGEWHTGPWTYEVSQRLREGLDNLCRENHLRLQWAIDRRDMAVMEECHQTQQYLWACESELSDRDTAAVENSRWEHQQWRASRHYAWSRTHLLTFVLRAAHTGTLAPDWRNHLSADLADYHRTIGINAADDMAAVVIHELATMPPQLWEPYVADGDWRVALDAWYRDSLALHDWSHQQIKRSGHPGRDRPARSSRSSPPSACAAKPWKPDAPR